MENHDMIRDCGGAVIIIVVAVGLVLSCSKIIYEDKPYLFLGVLLILFILGVVLLCVNVYENGKASCLSNDLMWSSRGFQYFTYGSVPSEFIDFCYGDSDRTYDQLGNRDAKHQVKSDCGVSNVQGKLKIE
ncbi:MAG: hypothetical protein ACTJLM_04765 [Ehrlichia sp.]